MEFKKSFSQTLEVKDADEWIVSGYLSAFGNIDSDGDMIMPGAFKKTIAEWGPQGIGRIKHFMDHDNTKLIGVFTVLKEDDYGLYYESQIGDWNDGVDFYKKVKKKAITEHSIGFRTIKKEKSEGHTKLTEIKLYEGSSLNGHGANQFTPIMGFKSMGDMDAYWDRLEFAVKNKTITDEELLRIESYCKNLLPLFKTTQPDADLGKTIVPDEQMKEDSDQSKLAEVFFHNFKNGLKNG